MEKQAWCDLCWQRVEHTTFAHESRLEGKASVLVCDACIRRYRSRLEVLGVDFIFVTRSAGSEKE